MKRRRCALTCAARPKGKRRRPNPRARRTAKKKSRPRSICRTSPGREMCSEPSRSRKKQSRIRQSRSRLRLSLPSLQSSQWRSQRHLLPRLRLRPRHQRDLRRRFPSRSPWLLHLRLSLCRHRVLYHHLPCPHRLRRRRSRQPQRLPRFRPVRLRRRPLQRRRRRPA